MFRSNFHHYSWTTASQDGTMKTQEDILRQQYLSLLAYFSAAFPDIEPPASNWWGLWLQRYDLLDIRAAIQTLSNHHLKPRFTTESTGKAISAMLRQSALSRAMKPPSVTGGQS
jgi:hypothetical protein